ALSVMNLAWGAGAISSSPLAMLAMRTSHVSLLLNVVGVLGVVLALGLLRMPFGNPPQEENASSGEAKEEMAGTGAAILLVTLFGGAFLAGLGLASIFPILIAWLSKWYGTRARKVGGVMFALAALGSALMPPLVGVVSRYSESLRIGLLVPLAGCVAMLTVIGLLRPGTRG